MKKNQLIRQSIIAGMFLAFSHLPANSQSTYNLIWSDEFETAGVPDASKWAYDIGGNGWGNHELQYYTNRSENVKVENGRLIITARKENYSSNAYTSTRIVTKNKGDWKYCRVEVMAKLPEGRGTWPAIWMLPTDWEYGGWPASGEIDIMEHVGYEMGNVHGTIHVEAYHGANGKGKGVYLDDVHTAFHEYAIEWTPDSIHFFIDDEHYFTYPNYQTGFERWPFDKRFHLLLNIAVGGDWGGAQGVDDSVFPQSMEIEYVRVYQKFQKQHIEGPSKLDAYQQNVAYSITTYPGVSYTWEFPEGVEFVSGQGTSNVLVNWGNVGGDIKVEQKLNDEVFNSSLSVEVVQVPLSDTLTIPGNETQIGTWSIHEGEGNTISISNEE